MIQNATPAAKLRMACRDTMVKHGEDAKATVTLSSQGYGDSDKWPSMSSVRQYGYEMGGSREGCAATFSEGMETKE